MANSPRHRMTIETLHRELASTVTAAPGAVRGSVSGYAVASLVFGALASIVFIDWSLIFLPLVGIALALASLRSIQQRGGELTGRRLALAGLGLSILFGAVGCTWLSLAKVFEVPHGYIAVTYRELQADYAAGEQIPARAFELDGKKIFVKGYMYPSRRLYGLKEFIISRENGTCDYCTPNPTPTDLLAVALEGDKRTNYTTHIVALGGKLRVETDPVKIIRDGIVYHLEADYIK